MIIAVAENLQCRDKVLEILLSYAGRDSAGACLTENVLQATLVAAAENSHCGDKVLSLLLSYDRVGVHTCLTEDILMAAAKNETCGDKLICLLRSCIYDPSLSLYPRLSLFSRSVFATAAENKGCGDKVLNLFMSLERLRNDVLSIAIAASENEGCGDKVIDLISCCQPEVDLLFIAGLASQGNCKRIAQRIFDSRLIQALDSKHRDVTICTHMIKTSSMGQTEDVEDAFGHFSCQSDFEVKITEHIVQNAALSSENDLRIKESSANTFETTC